MQGAADMVLSMMEKILNNTLAPKSEGRRSCGPTDSVQSELIEAAKGLLNTEAKLSVLNTVKFSTLSP